MRAKILEQYPDTLGKDDGVLLEQIWPKKEGITLVKFRWVTWLIVRLKDPMLTPASCLQSVASTFRYWCTTRSRSSSNTSKVLTSHLCIFYTNVGSKIGPCLYEISSATDENTLQTHSYYQQYK